MFRLGALTERCEHHNSDDPTEENREFHIHLNLSGKQYLGWNRPKSVVSSARAADTFHERYIPALDGIRGIAILAVILHHCRFLLNPAFRFQYFVVKLLELGWCGVVLFFVLSGFLITGILLDSRTSPNYFSTFYLRRFLRIFPLYYGYLVLAFVGLPIFYSVIGGVYPLARTNPWWYIGYMQNFRPNTAIVDPLIGHLWSLAVEEQFYLVWPLLILLVRPGAVSWICSALIPLSLLIRLHYAGRTGDLDAFVNTFTPASLDSLASGALVALAVRSPVWRRRAALVARPLIVACLIWFCILGWRAGGLFEYQTPIQTWGITALTLLFASVIFVAATSGGGAMAAVFQLHTLRFTGKISYGLYVLHPLVMAALAPVFAAVPTTVALVDLGLNSEKILLVLLSSIAVAAASWFCFEKPILALKNRFPYERATLARRTIGEAQRSSESGSESSALRRSLRR
jgi:peptidoglycan/LPS O-acetylase OafA/YrhL